MSIKIEPKIYISTNSVPSISNQAHIQRRMDITKQEAKTDSFELSFGRGMQKQSFLSKIFRKYDDSFCVPEYNSGIEASDFAKDIAKCIKEKTNTDIPASNLANIVSPEEFRELLPTFEAKNFKRNPENLENCIYCADLDYQSNYSTGKEPVYDILERVTEQADAFVALQQANGIPEEDIKPFYFALSDRDSIEGVQQAVKIIGENPEKYKNLKFIPAIKLTYAHPADTSALGYENSDMLVYGINPFSDNLINYLDHIIEKRKKMILDFISELSELYPGLEYDIKEFMHQNKIKYLRSFAVSNLYWRVREYAQKKGNETIKGLHIAPEAIFKSVNSIFQSMGIIQTGSNRAALSDPYASSTRQDEEFNRSIKNVFTKYSTHYEEESSEVVSAGENLYEYMIECLSKEKEKPVLALSAPIYLAHYFEEPNSKTFSNVVSFIENLKSKSNGMLCAFQSITPNYGIDNDLNRKKIKLFNNYIRNNTTLYEVGGSFDGVMLN